MILYKKTIEVWSDVPGYGDDIVQRLKNNGEPIVVYGLGEEKELDSTTDPDAEEVVEQGGFSG